jgi:hypothetical protein
MLRYSWTPSFEDQLEEGLMRDEYDTNNYIQKYASEFPGINDHPDGYVTEMSSIGYGSHTSNMSLMTGSGKKTTPHLAKTQKRSYRMARQI